MFFAGAANSAPLKSPNVFALKHALIIGTRSSPLALWQAEFVKAELLHRFPQLAISLRHIKTTGDKILDSPLSKIGDKGLFTREIEHALLRGEIDLAVHSLKDLPTQTPDGLVISAITTREDTRDVLISKNGETLDTLRSNARIATGSLRRRAQLLAHRPDLQIVEMRGNLNTRFKKFNDDGTLDAMILAFAGVHRLGFDARISEIITHDKMLPAVGQGALGIETRVDDSQTNALIGTLNDFSTALCTKAERALLRRLEGGCQIPIGAFASLENQTLSLSAFIGSLDGARSVRKSLSRQAVVSIDDAEETGKTLAEELLHAGGKDILQEIRASV